MNLSGWIMKRAGWTFKVNLTMPDKCVIVIAPHTSNWDFILGELAIHSVGMKAGFLMKDTWFFFPLGYLLKGLGGIPVNRRQHGNLTQSIVEAYNATPKLAIGVTPEGTRSANPNWHKGAIFMARDAGVPLVLAYFDYKEHVVCIDKVFELSDDAEADLLRIKQYYRHCHAKYPEKFVTGLED
jgi:1-acyl-sn-glycerol-3-phosphate acyltransferase